jgi:drug/metabolite transporter (DMT)-like permease
LLVLAAARGLVTLAEQHIPSGLAALLVASVPLWVVLLRLLHGEHVRAQAFFGVITGFAGVALLMVPSGLSGPAPTVWLVTLLVAAMCEAAGGFYSSWLPLPSDALLGAALQMLIAGSSLLLAALIAGETYQLDPSIWSGESMIALLYLMVRVRS